MLQSLYIENVAVIEKTTMDLRRGLNVITGETGAGKSVLLGAVGAILGGRTSRDIVRRGSKKAVIHALFENLSSSSAATAQEMGYLDEGEASLLIVREIEQDGKNTCKVNGKPANVAILRSLGAGLIDVHGQHDNQRLLNESQHIDILDRYAKIDNLMGTYQEQFERVRKLKREILDLEEQQNDRERQIDLLSYQINEIENANLEPGEEERLKEMLGIAKYAELITTNLQTAQLTLSGDEDTDGAQGLMTQAVQALEAIRDVLPGVGPIADKLTAMGYELEEYITDLSSVYEPDPDGYQNIDFMESRLHTIDTLNKKYGGNIEEVLHYRDTCQKQLDSVQNSDEYLEELNERLRTELQIAKDLALKISAKRKRAGEQFAANVCEELQFLNMEGVTFVVQVQQERKLHANGLDQVTFLISANVGEEPKSISKIASGGELSRVMLAIKNILAESDSVETLIFDEIDTGVSGSASQKIGQKLKQVSQSHQVICVTHSAGVAAFGNNHLLVEKTSDETRTYTDIRALSEEERVEELARIVSGDHITQLSRENAREMLDFATKC